MPNIKTNYAYNLINTVSGLLFPLLTFPYAARVLLADGVGQVQFFSSIISYIALFSGLGIPLYAIREIADRMSLKSIRKEIDKLAGNSGQPAEEEESLFSFHPAPGPAASEPADTMTQMDLF